MSPLPPRVEPIRLPPPRPPTPAKPAGRPAVLPRPIRRVENLRMLGLILLYHPPRHKKLETKICCVTPPDFTSVEIRIYITSSIQQVNSISHKRSQNVHRLFAFQYGPLNIGFPKFLKHSHTICYLLL